MFRDLSHSGRFLKISKKLFYNRRIIRTEKKQILTQNCKQQKITEDGKKDHIKSENIRKNIKNDKNMKKYIKK